MRMKMCFILMVVSVLPTALFASRDPKRLILDDDAIYARRDAKGLVTDTRIMSGIDWRITLVRDMCVEEDNGTLTESLKEFTPGRFSFVPVDLDSKPTGEPAVSETAESLLALYVTYGKAYRLWIENNCAPSFLDAVRENTKDAMPGRVPPKALMKYKKNKNLKK